MISRLLDRLSEFLAHRKGLLPIVGIVMILFNLLIQIILPGNLLATTNLFLHIGLVTAIFGLMLAWAL
ncbi:MAG: hypothetical protein HY864_07840 [Chloroflexi bacterium]|nr:hypothetical protein [Chloroflexota bacterium]